jgi:hypothetical protein
MCGSLVRTRQQRLPRTLADTHDETVEVRVCTNRSCASNTGQMSLADVV